MVSVSLDPGIRPAAAPGRSSQPDESDGAQQMLTKALFVRLEALPGKEKELADFLTQARSIVMEEPGTIAWFAIQLGPSTFGVYDAFPDEEARDAHLAGGVGQALGANTGVLFSEPQIEHVDILTEKMPENQT
jgi:quinol monooxygenase YgiN